MVTDESIKRQVSLWANKIGHPDAIRKLRRFGVSERMAYYLVSGKYGRNISLKKAESIVRAMR